MFRNVLFASLLLVTNSSPGLGTRCEPLRLASVVATSLDNVRVARAYARVSLAAYVNLRYDLNKIREITLGDWVYNERNDRYIIPFSGTWTEHGAFSTGPFTSEFILRCDGDGCNARIERLSRDSNDSLGCLDD